MKQKTRFLYLDLLRGWALIFMIDAHVFNAFMNPALRSEWWFGILNYLNGLVAPGFLFVSGAVFYISTYGKSDELRTFGSLFRKRFYRILLIFIAGYSLHLPFLSLERMINEADAPTLTSFFSVDILQCIGAGLLLILLVKLIVKSERTFAYILSGLCIFIISVSPTVWKSGIHESLPYFIAAYFTPVKGSLFPLFPWLSFLLAGAVFAYVYLDIKRKGKEAVLIKYITISGAVIAIAGFILLSDIILPENIRLIRPNPIFTFQRLGFILFLTGSFWYYHSLKGEKASFVTEVAKESLLVYWLHLQIIYRRFYDGESLASLVDNRFNGLESAAAYIVLTLMMIFTAVGWSRMKKEYPVYTMLLARGVIWGCIIVFLLT